MEYLGIQPAFTQDLVGFNEQGAKDSRSRDWHESLKCAQNLIICSVVWDLVGLYAESTLVKHDDTLKCVVNSRGSNRYGTYTIYIPNDSGNTREP